MWGSELGWRGQRDWEREMDPQYQVLSKCVSVTRGARKELVSQIAGVESPRMALDVGRWVEMMRDPTALADLLLENGESVKEGEKGRNVEAGRGWATITRNISTASLR